MAAFAAAGTALVALMFAAALVVATAQEQLIEGAREHSPTLKRAGGWVLFAVGAWMLALAALAKPLARIFPV